jgi:hypothetical protein
MKKEGERRKEHEGGKERRVTPLAGRRKTERRKERA